MAELTNIWFYTLSTSAQVLAALVGLFAVFVVYKLQGTDPSLKDVRAITIKFLLYYSSNIKIKTFVKCMITDLVLKSDLGILEKFNAILEIYKKEPQNCNITYGSSGELFKSNLFPGLIFDLDDKTFNYYKEIVQQKSDTSKRLLASLILGFILTALCIFELNLINIFLDLKILFFTSSAIALYFVLITMSVYKISIK